MRTGTFLALKMRNMQVWAAELLPEKDIIRRNKLLDKSVSELEATAVATSLKKHEAVISKSEGALAEHEAVVAKMEGQRLAQQKHMRASKGPSSTWVT